jgi:putative ABC transport system permease protein
LPLQGERWSKQISFTDRPVPASLDEVPSVQYRPVGGHYFESLHIALVNGRLFREEDTQRSQPVAIVNQALARRFWPDQNPVGKNITLYPPESLIQPGQLPPGYHIPRITVVGVVADVHYGALTRQVAPIVYAPFVQNDWSNSMSVTIQVSGEPGNIVSAVRKAVLEIDKNQPIANVLTMEEIVHLSVTQPRLETLLLGLFGGLAVTLAAIGIYGLMSYSVTQRAREIGIRIALGANRSTVFRMILSQALSLAGIGVAIGLVGALVFSRLLQSMLFNVKPADPPVFAGILALLLGIALLASYVPARRATKVEPIEALRYQ